jgi:hypothetical protein
MVNASFLKDWLLPPAYDGASGLITIPQHSSKLNFQYEQVSLYIL